MILAVSTGNGSPHKTRCLESVASQSAEHVHVYTDAAEQATPRGAMENQWRTLEQAGQSYDGNTVAVLVDGDDWLPHPDCLARVQAEHEAGAWLTWGSFVFADGRPGIAAEYGADDPRSTPWRMSHLKSFRLGLFWKLDRGDVQRDGAWLEHSRDLAVMLPLYELCPPERRRFIPDVIYTYNLAASFEWTASPADLAREQLDVAYVRSRPRYAAVERL